MKKQKKQKSQKKAKVQKINKENLKNIRGGILCQTRCCEKSVPTTGISRKIDRNGGQSS